MEKHIFFMASQHNMLPLEYNEWGRVDLDLGSIAFMCVGTLIQDYHDSFCILLHLDIQQLLKTDKKMLKIKEKTPFWVRQTNLK